MKTRPILHAVLWFAAGSALAQMQPAPMPRTPAPDMVPPPVTQPDAVRHAGGPEESRMEADPFMDFSDPRVRSEMSECTNRPRDARSDCVRGIRPGRESAPIAPAGSMRERRPPAPQDSGMPLRDRDPGVSTPR
ncbi:hypothetical protein M8A51_24525 [Schlegelella sp. S2-27]|uniref:Uncharacterized protein n=1 Tax=Caldimonas mangrovi TaxID=2944811 RepID=A0ABT0YVE3_9BURK|nr:hypothetical protein [Caldimonas mangrovi]MCM5682710.1 hypothetical protein [Caldimonas mangrovi]